MDYDVRNDEDIAILRSDESIPPIKTAILSCVIINFAFRTGIDRCTNMHNINTKTGQWYTTAGIIEKSE